MRFHAPTMLCFALAACGGGEPEAQAPVAAMSPEDQILRLGRTWESAWGENGFRNPPSPIARFDTKVTSRIAFQPGATTARETLSLASTFRLTTGGNYTCAAGGDVRVAVRWGDHAGEPAVEVRRPAVRLVQRCTPPDFPEPALDMPAVAARFALRGDRLVPLAPPTEKREYIPAQ
jgi:hypothetical protein